VDQEAAGIRILLNGTQDHLIKYGAQESVMRDEYTLNGNVASVLKDTFGTITSMFLGQGTRFSDQHDARQLIRADVPATLEVTYSDSWVRVSGDFTGGTTVTVYSPQLQDVTVNRQYVSTVRFGDHIQFTIPQ
jgi:hypothetical protein